MTFTIDQPVWYIGADAHPDSIAAREGVIHAINGSEVDIRFGNAISRFPLVDVIPAAHDMQCESEEVYPGRATPCQCRDRAITNRVTPPTDADRHALVVAIGYDPIRVSIAGHPDITETFRTADDRDNLIERILAAGFRLTPTMQAA